MFWETKDPPSHNIELLLESPDTKVEVFLEEENIIQECKTFNKHIVNYFTRPDVIRRMIELITTEPPEDVPMNERFRHAYVACEILTMGLPSLDEKLLADTDTLNMLYSYLENEPPLNPLLASFFSKTFSMLFTKKSDQDWFLYQQTCLKLLEYLKTKNNFLDLICKHFTTPIVPDLIMEIMQNVESEVKKNLFDWLNEERLVEKLIEIIGDPGQSEKHANVADFLCDLIHQGRTMRQDIESFEPAFGGSDPILQKIESATTLLALFNVILQPNTVESTIVSGIAIVLRLMKPVEITDKRTLMFMLLAGENEEEKESLTTVIRVIEPQIKYFNELLKIPPKKPEIVTSAATLSPPFGMTRLQIVRLFTELLKTKNDDLIKAICETNFLDTLMSLFKEYCWNNFLHSEVEKCLHCIFPYADTPPKAKTNNSLAAPADGITKEKTDEADSDDFNSEFFLSPRKQSTPQQPGSSPSDIQIHAIVNCQIVSKLIECWKMNKDTETAEKGRRLGFMGHLIEIFKHITKCISESEFIGALIEKNLKDDNERELWQSIVNKTDGELTKLLSVQSKLLADHDPSQYNASLDFFNDNNISDAFNGLCTIMDSSDALRRTNDDDEGDEGDEDDNATAHFDNDGGFSFCVDPHVNPFESGDDDATLNILDKVFYMLAHEEDNMPYFRTSNEVTAAAAGTTAPTQASNVLTTSSEEYDNNANVEKSTTSCSGDFTSFQIPKKDTPFASNFVDDYEDDEGMWTKPLGASTSTLTAGQFVAEPFDPFGQTNVFETNFTTNGPSLLLDEQHGDHAPEVSIPNQLNNSIEDNTLVDQTTKDITPNDTKGELIKEINKEETTSKHKSNTPDTNDTETSTDNSTANAPTNQPTNTATTAEESTDVSTTM